MKNAVLYAENRLAQYLKFTILSLWHEAELMLTTIWLGYALIAMR